MQIVGLDQGKKIWAKDAKMGEIYNCPDCGHPIRKRGGYLLKPHFFHITKSPNCNGKSRSAAHMQAQEWLLHLLRSENASTEHPFPQINRIADVYWPEKTIVFEIQYSGITFHEMAERCSDYAKIGLYVVWLLHDKMFTPSIAIEQNLESIPHYYITIDDLGTGYCYDQIVTKRGRSVKTIVNPAHPIPFSRIEFDIPPWLYRRSQSFTWAFSGDLYDRYRCGLPVMMQKISTKSYYEKVLDRILRRYN